MKKAMELVLDIVVMFAFIMIAAGQNPAFNDLLVDIIYWFNMEEYVTQAIIGISAVVGCMVFAVENVVFALIYDLYKVLRAAFTATKKYFGRKAA